MKTIETILHFLRSLSLEEILLYVFLSCFFIELLSRKARRLKIHSLSDSINNLLIGGISFIFDFAFSMATFPLWMYLYEHCSIFSINSSKLSMFLLLFLLVDFSEYWFHRLSHEINLLWAAHVVHHQSEHFNLSVGLRTSFFIPLFNIFIYVLFPLAGFDPADLLLIIFIQGICQLLIHTRLIGKLGFLEYIIVTPSSHRVHHGKNEIYIDKNYGKFFIVWDRLFGTYQEETEEVEFGITAPLEKDGPLYSLIEPYRKLVKLFKEAEEKEQRNSVLFGRPSEIKK